MEENVQRSKLPGPESGIEIRKTMCSICNPDSHCGIDAYVKDGRLIKVEGTAGNPHSGGTLCAKGAAQRQYVYHKERLLYPMKRIGRRGSDGFVRITWEEAYQQIAERLMEQKARYGAKSVCFFSGFAKWYRPGLMRLASAFGTPNYGTESSTCFRATQLAWKLVFGAGTQPDFQNAGLLVLWSKNPAYSQSYQTRLIMDRLEQGMKLIAVDPRDTPMTRRADIHLKLKPGTDGALALSIAHVMIKEQIYDEEFVGQYTYGFQEYKEYVQQFPPEIGESLTGVPKEQIIAAARMYASVKPGAMMVSASPVVHHVNGVQNYRAVMMLVGLTGNYDVRGGNVVTPYGYCYSSSFVKTNERAFEGERYDGEPGIGEEEFPVWFRLIRDEVQAVRIPDYILEKKPYEIKSIIGFGLNHRMWPDSNHMRKALEQVDFFVNTELFMTPTCRYADILLPACTSMERSQIRVYQENYLFCSEPAIEPLGESRHDMQIILDLARSLDLKDEMLSLSYEEFMDFLIKPAGVSLEELRKHREGMYAPVIQPHEERGYQKTGFATPSGKMEFVSQVLADYPERPGYDPLPVYRSRSQVYPALSSEEYPLLLCAGCRKPQLVHTRCYRMPWLAGLENTALADLHPEDGAALNLSQGEEIWISTPKGRIAALANLTAIGQKGVVFLYHGHPDRDPNELIDKDYLDPISGFPGYKSFPCKVEKKSPEAARQSRSGNQRTAKEKLAGAVKKHRGVQLRPDRCTGCYACVTACLDQHYETEEEAIALRRVEPTATGFRSISCMHCTDAPCMAVCAAGALHFDPETGFVLADPSRCIGCHRCESACPYGVPRFDKNNRMHKCDGCSERVKAGLPPACVAACPSRALK